MLNILIIGQDPTLFRSGADAFGDARPRHTAYARELAARHPGSQIRMITYTPRGTGRLCEKVSPHLFLYGTESRHRALFLLGVLARLRDTLADGWRPHLITAQTAWEEGLLGYLLSRRLGCRFMPQLHFNLFSSDWRREKFGNHARYLISRWVFRGADGIRVVCTSLGRDLASRFGVDPGRIEVVPVGVDFPIAAVDSARPSARSRAPTVLFVGRFYAPKNLKCWLDVAEQVRKRVPEARFLLAGAGPDYERIKARAEAMGLGVCTQFLGYVGRDALPDVYAAADLLLLTSHYEGFGRVVVEAYLAGIPVVSTACGGPEDIIDDGKSGHLCAAGDPADLADKVSELLLDADQRREFGRRGQAVIMDRFTLEKLTGDLIDSWERRALPAGRVASGAAA